MRLCYIADFRTIHTQRWIDYFVQHEHDIHLITNEPYAVLQGVKIHYILPHSLHKMRRGRGRIGLLLAKWVVTRQVQQIRPDILHAHFLRPYGWFAALSGFHPFVLTLWGGDIMPERGAFAFPRNHLIAFTLKRADLVTAFSQPLFTVAAPYLKPGTRTAFIRIGADRTTFNPAADRTLWRERLNLGNRPIVLSPRTFAPVYNLETIIAAIPLVREQIPDVCFLLKDKAPEAYREAYCTRMLQKINDLDISDAVRYVDEVHYQEMAALYRTADVVVSMARSEGFPVTAFEAMACDAPLVSGRLAQLEEVMTHEKHTLFVPLDDPQQLAYALVRVLTDPALRETMQTANRKLVELKGDFHAEMHKMEKLYQEMANT